MTLPELVVAVFERNPDQRHMLRLVVDCSARQMRASPCSVLSGDVGTVRRELARVGADLVIWDVSPTTLFECCAFSTLLREGAFAGRGLVVTTTDEVRLRRVMGSAADTLPILQKPYSIEEILMQLDYMAWTQQGRPSGGVIDSHLLSSQQRVH